MDVQQRDKIVLRCIAQNLRRRREAAGLSKSALARLINDWPAAIQRIEEEENMPGAGILVVLAEALECEVGDFFEGLELNQRAKAKAG
jgi:transcriptional regulator with XRE-family HTH domain